MGPTGKLLLPSFRFTFSGDLGGNLLLFSFYGFPFDPLHIVTWLVTLSEAGTFFPAVGGLSKLVNFVMAKSGPTVRHSRPLKCGFVAPDPQSPSFDASFHCSFTTISATAAVSNDCATGKAMHNYRF